MELGIEKGYGRIKTMELQYESCQNFIFSLKEVEILLNDAEVNEDEEIKYLTYNKSALLLLLAKFEKVVEEIIEEIVDHINGLGVNAKDIPNQIKVYHSILMFEKLKDVVGHDHKLEESIQLFIEVGEIWHSEEKFDKLKVSSKFNYGKHGEKELIKLFNNIGINNIFKEVKVFKNVESLIHDNVVEVDFKGVLNSVTKIRHNIIHQDATPDLTHIQIGDYTETFRSFVLQLDQYLYNFEKVFKEICSGYESAV